jgi:phage-related protein
VSTIEILTSVLLILASVLCFALIYFINRIVKSVHSISVDIKALSFRVNPLIESMLKGSEKINHIADIVDSQLKVTSSVVSRIREHVDDILNVETKIRNGIEDAVMPIIKNVNAVGTGVGTFWKKYRAGKQNKFIL